jgi:hypothetical protein
VDEALKGVAVSRQPGMMLLISLAILVAFGPIRFGQDRNRAELGC